MNPRAVDLQTQFGPIDIYLFDQLLRGNLRPGMRIVDAGCGGGRNLHYFAQNNYDLYAVDSNPEAIAAVAQHFPTVKACAAPVENMPFSADFADVVLSSAVLHFARDDNQFAAMLTEMWRILKPGGLLFARLASTIGIEHQVRCLDTARRRYLLPDGSERFLVDEQLLMGWTRRLNATLVDPLKTTVVQNQRSMTTWVLRKST